MQQPQQPSGSATRWGPMFGAGADAWAETWEGSDGWGTAVYNHVLDRMQIGPGVHLLDCGCGAGRFARMAADRGARVAGIDAAEPFIRIAEQRTPHADFRVGDLEALPWADAAFDVVTGFSSFQFADDKRGALSEARRVSRGPVVVVIPTRVPEMDLRVVFTPMFPLFPPEALESQRQSGMFAMSEPGQLEETLAAADLTPYADDEIESRIAFRDMETATRAMLAAGPISIAIRHAGQQAVAEVLRSGLEPFVAADGTITLSGWYRVVFANRENVSR